MKNSDFIFFTTIKACHLNNHFPKNEINVAGTFRDIEVQSCAFGIVYCYKIRKEWDRIYGRAETRQTSKCL